MNKITSQDCLSCGICCMPFGYQDVFCDLDRDDIKRLGSKARGKVHRPGLFEHALSMLRPYGSTPDAVLKTKIKLQRSGPFKGKEICTCCFLSGPPLKKVRCEVYRNRPKTCHTAVKPGDRSCRKARKFWKEIVRDQCR